MSRELLQQALDALEYHTQQTRPIHSTEWAIDAQGRTRLIGGGDQDIDAFLTRLLRKAA